VAEKNPCTRAATAACKEPLAQAALATRKQPLAQGASAARKEPLAQVASRWVTSYKSAALVKVGGQNRGPISKPWPPSWDPYADR